MGDEEDGDGELRRCTASRWGPPGREARPAPCPHSAVLLGAVPWPRSAPADLLHRGSVSCMGSRHCWYLQLVIAAERVQHR